MMDEILQMYILHLIQNCEIDDDQMFFFYFLFLLLIMPLIKKNGYFNYGFGHRRRPHQLITKIAKFIMIIETLY